MAAPLTPRQKKLLLVGGGLALGVLGIYAGLIIYPLAKKSAEYRTQIETAKQQLAMLQTVTARQGSLKQQHQQLQTAVASWQERLPQEEGLSAAVDLFSSFASSSGVKVLAIVPQAEPSDPAKDAKPGEYKKVSFQTIHLQVDVMAGFHQLGRFVHAIESSTAPMQIVSLRISSSGKDTKQRVQMRVNAFVAASQEGQASVRRVLLAGGR